MNIALAIGRILGGGSRFGRRFAGWFLEGVVRIARLRVGLRMLGDGLGEKVCGMRMGRSRFEEHLFLYRAGRFVKVG
jgi:hypothetical protein